MKQIEIKQAQLRGAVTFPGADAMTWISVDEGESRNRVDKIVLEPKTRMLLIERKGTAREVPMEAVLRIERVEPRWLPKPKPAEAPEPEPEAAPEQETAGLDSEPVEE